MIKSTSLVEHLKIKFNAKNYFNLVLINRIVNNKTRHKSQNENFIINIIFYK